MFQNPAFQVQSVCESLERPADDSHMCSSKSEKSRSPTNRTFRHIERASGAETCRSRRSSSLVLSDRWNPDAGQEHEIRAVFANTAANTARGAPNQIRPAIAPNTDDANPRTEPQSVRATTPQRASHGPRSRGLTHVSSSSVHWPHGLSLSGRADDSAETRRRTRQPVERRPRSRARSHRSTVRTAAA